MARRNRRGPQQVLPLSAGTVRSREEHADGPWIVATHPGRADERRYTCPICGGPIAAAAAHVVVWPESASSADRRHVHTNCWRRRASQRNPVRW